MPEKILRHFCDRLLANLKIDCGPHLLRSGHFERYGDFAPTTQIAVLRPHFLIHRRPDQSAPTERTEVYLNTAFSHGYLPIFLVQKQETSSPSVGHPHKPETALGVEELLQLCTAVGHGADSNFNGFFQLTVDNAQNNSMSDMGIYQQLRVVGDVRV